MVPITFKSGLDLNIFEQHEFEALNHTSDESDALIIARNTLRFLMMGWSSSWTELITWPVFKAVFIQRDPVLMKALRLAFQQGFMHLFQQLSGRLLNEQQTEQVQLYLSNCLSLLPYADLTPYESIKIPQLINHQWELVEYFVTAIELTSAKDILKDKDRVFAYGLQPITQKNAQSHLIFMGTTYPAGQGFLSQIKTDFKAFEPVGTTLYHHGKERIAQWLGQQKSKVHVCGVSLGGALSLLLVLDQGEYIERVDALNSPGLVETKAKNIWDKWNALDCKPKVVIQIQANDPISLFGVWKKEWELVRVTPPKDKQGPNSFCDHFLNYAGFAQTEFSYISAEEQNFKRRYLHDVLFSYGRGAVYYALIWPYSSLLRPLVYSTYEFWRRKSAHLSAGVTLTAVFLFSFFSVTLFYLAVGSLALGLFSYNFFMPWLLKKMNSNDREVKSDVLETAALHHPKLARNFALDIYNAHNALEVELSYSQLNTYYSVMRGLVKQKEGVPTSDKPYKHNKNLTKKDLLLACVNPENSDKTVRLHMTKAKLIHVRRILDIAQHIGIENKKELQEAVYNEYHHYSLGK